VTARLHLLLGAGGVGKTTLAAGYALALAREPRRRVGLLGIDPARRLQDALGVPLSDLEAPVPSVGTLHAALLHPADSLRRWTAEALPDTDSRARLLANPFFIALADRLATATDIFAAARVAEWAERDPSLTDLVVDTAPGQNAIEFLRRPERLAAFLEGRLVRWLRWFARSERGGPLGEALGGGARRVVWGLVRIGGTQLLLDLAEFFSLVEAVFARMLTRVKATEHWLRDPATEILVVTSVRDDGGRMTRELADALRDVRLAPRAIVINRAVPAGFVRELQALDGAPGLPPEGVRVLRYAVAYAKMQDRLVTGLKELAPATVVIGACAGLDGGERLAALDELGRALRRGLAEP
jgi:anion-transporting  ArsA/GET3 family ATPase